MNKFARNFGIVLMVLVLFFGWYLAATDYDYGALAGTYRFRGQGVSSKLVLRLDHTFYQEVTQGGHTITAQGTWRLFGEAHVNFSIEFLRVPGAETSIEEFGKGDGSIEDNEFFGHFEKILGIYPILKINANPPGPTFHKTWLH
jgi:hypothetical protein